MELKLPAFEKHVQAGLSACYLVAGAEPLQVLESCEKIRNAARQQGFDERVVINADAKMDWSELYAEASAMSLFSQKKIIDLRIANGKPGREGGKAIQDYLKTPPADTILLVSCLSGDKSTRQSAWSKAIAKAGVTLFLWPVALEELPRWIDMRMRAQGLQPDTEVSQFLSERVEGNLLAAAQEIDKLLVVHGAGPINLEQVRAQAADSARYEVYGLFDCAVSGDMARAIRMLSGLKAEGVASVLVHWALTDQIRLMSRLSQARAQGVPMNQALQQAGVWASRRQQAQSAMATYPASRWRSMLSECLHLDKVIKGRAAGEFWMECERLLARIAARRRQKVA